MIAVKQSKLTSFTFIMKEHGFILIKQLNTGILRQSCLKSDPVLPTFRFNTV